jgi:EcsC protein family
MLLNELSAYEQAKLEQIARWKGWRPGAFTQAVEFVKRPADRLFARAVTGERLTKLLIKINGNADWSIPLNLIRREAGVTDVRELRSGSLERCDELEARVKRVGAAEVTTESLLGGVGGLATELASIPVELMLMLRTVYRVARCYGYDLESEKHKTVVFAVIGVSMLTVPEDRQRWCEKIWDMIHRAESDADLTEEEHLLNEQFRREVIDEVMQGVAVELLENKIEEAVPLLGDVIGVVLDNAFIHKIELAARCIFQEFWLRENHKVEVIAPRETTRPLATTIGVSLSRAAYLMAYGLGFGVTLPSLMLSRAGATVLPDTVLEGLQSGGADAADHVTHVLANGKPVNVTNTISEAL